MNRQSYHEFWKYQNNGLKFTFWHTIHLYLISSLLSINIISSLFGDDLSHIELSQIKYSTDGKVQNQLSGQPFKITEVSWDGHKVAIQAVEQKLNLNNGEILLVDSKTNIPNGPWDNSESSFKLKRWTKKHGLPVNKVRCLLQSKKGQIWVGTEEGLCRFDGLRFSKPSVVSSILTAGSTL